MSSVNIRLGSESLHSTWVNGGARKSWKRPLLRLMVGRFCVHAEVVNVPEMAQNYDVSSYPRVEDMTEEIKQRGKFLFEATEQEVSLLEAALADSSNREDMDLMDVKSMFLMIKK